MVCIQFQQRHKYTKESHRVWARWENGAVVHPLMVRQGSAKAVAVAVLHVLHVPASQENAHSLLLRLVCFDG
jgi:hypothetical protein